MKKNLYVTDLDGTLLNKKGRLSEFTKTNLQKLIDSGVNITFASGRNIVEMKHALEGLKPRLPILSLNGSIISDFYTDEIIYSYPIKNNNKKIIEAFANSEYFISTISKDKKYNLYFKGSSDNNRLKLIKKINRPKSINIPTDIDEDLILLAAGGNKKEIDIIENKIISTPNLFIDRWESVYFDSYWISVQSIESNKGLAAKKLASEIRDIDKIICFGDSSNDITLFEHADISYAVDNAIDKLKEISTEVIDNHKTDSVIKKIIELEGLNKD